MAPVTARRLGWALPAVLVCLLLGAAGGYGLATRLDEEPRPMTTAPLAASSPSFPTDPPIEVLPDPKYPALETGTRFGKPVRVGSDSFGVTVRVPAGWGRTDTDLVESKWAPIGSPLNTYLLRVKIISGQHLTVRQAREQRRAALSSVVTEWQLEDETVDTFVATYVNDDYRRLAMERFLSVDGSDAAFVTVAVIGRVEDRAGLKDLLDRVSASVRR